MATASKPIILNLTGMQLASEMNTRGHWSKRYKRANGQKQRVHWELTAARHNLPKPPCVIRFVRCYNGRGKPYDDDNLRAAWKGPRDAVAAFFGVDDSARSPLQFEYVQEHGTSALRMEIHPLTAGEKE